VRTAVVATAVSFSILGLSVADNVRAAIRKHTEIPAEDLASALKSLAQERDFQVLYRSDLVGDLQTHGASGELTSQEALKQLLRDTGLTFQYLDEATVTIVPMASGPANAVAPQETTSGRQSAPDGVNAPGTDTSREGEVKQSSIWDRFRLAQASQTVLTETTSVERNKEQASQQEPATLQEVVVTAQKREEREQDVPVAMTVLDPQVLAENGQVRLVDYFSTVPGVTLNSNNDGGGTQYVAIRGLTTGTAQNATVAVVIDDVLTSSGAALDFANITVPDLDPSDLARIEVLKGPQGTLYGADSLGGIIKYVTADPSTSGYSGRVEVAGTDIPGGGLGYAVRGAANLPLSDALAIRVSGFTRRDPGFIDNITSGQSNVNSADVFGSHFAALWRPAEDVSLKVSALIQQTDGHGSPSFNAQLSANGTLQPELDYLTQTGLRFANPYRAQQQLYSATLNAKVAGIDVVSVTGYSVHKFQNQADWNGLAGFANNTFNKPPPGVNLGVAGAGFAEGFETDKFSQELRLSSSIGHWLDWLAGGYYTREVAPAAEAYQNFISVNPATQAPVSVLTHSIEGPYTLSESAVFADLTIHFTDQFNVQFGGREAWYRQASAEENVGPGVIDLYGKPSPDIAPTLHATGNAFTYLVTPQFKISPDMMAYARVATGYRIGAVNGNFGQPGVPRSSNPDKTTNYELGLKGDFLEHRLNVDLSGYYVNWHNFQLAVQPNGFFFTTNGGDAKSEGVELSLQARPTTGLTISAQSSYNNAALTQDLPPAAVVAGAYGLTGTRLPYSIRWSGGVSVNQDIPITNGWTGVLGAAVNYVGLRYGEFAGGPTAVRAQFPAYTTADLRTGARYDGWLINLYLNNVGDKRGIVGANSFVPATGVTHLYYGTLIQPRTVGLSIVKTF